MYQCFKKSDEEEVLEFLESTKNTYDIISIVYKSGYYRPFIIYVKDKETPLPKESKTL